MRDVIIVGAGKAGLAAGIQCKSAGLDVVLIAGIPTAKRIELLNAGSQGLDVAFD